MGLVALAGFEREIGEIVDEKIDAIPTQGLKETIATAIEMEGITL